MLSVFHQLIFNQQKIISSPKLQSNPGFWCESCSRTRILEVIFRDYLTNCSDTMLALTVCPCNSLRYPPVSLKEDTSDFASFSPFTTNLAYFSLQLTIPHTMFHDIFLPFKAHIGFCSFLYYVKINDKTQLH